MKPFPPNRILVPTDLSEPSNVALAHTRVFMEEFGSAVTVLHAEQFEAPPYFTRGQMESLEQQRRSVVREAADTIADHSAAIVGTRPRAIVREGQATRVILEVADEEDSDLLVMGTHGRSGVERLWLGSVTERVIRQSRRPVLAVHAASSAQYRRVLCAVSAEDVEGAVLGYGVSMAESLGAEILVVHATGADPRSVACPGVTDEVRRRCRVKEMPVRGEPARNILRIASEADPDIIVMGGRRWVSGLGEFFSTTTEKVMHAVETSLLVVPIRDVEERES